MSTVIMREREREREREKKKQTKNKPNTSYEGREGEIKYRKKSSKKNLKHISLFDMRNRM